MSIDKYKITRLTNRKPVDISKIQTTEKDSGIFMNYHQTIITQIVEAQEKREFECICAEIQKFIEENNIDVCFAINKNELIDCLQEHQNLKLELANLEAKLAESESRFQVHKQTDVRTIQDQTDLIDQLKQQLAEKEETIEKLKDESVKYYCTAFNYKENLKKLDKDKISFCIEKLEKVKDSVLDVSNGYWRYFITDGAEYMLSSDLESCLKEYIDDQIKELKEGK